MSEQIEKPNTDYAPRMGAYDGIYSQTFRYAPSTLDRLLLQLGWQIADDMLTMGTCRSAFNLKRYAIMSQGWEIVPAVTDPYSPDMEEAKRYADFIQWVCENILTAQGLPVDFRSVLFDTLRGFWDGFRVSEIGFRVVEGEEEEYDGLLALENVWGKKAKQIGFDLDPRTLDILHVTSYTPGSIATGAGQMVLVPGGYDFEVPLEKCLVYTANNDANLPQGDGDWRGCYKSWWALDNNLKFWIKALERFGAGALIGYGPQSALDLVQAALKDIRNGATGAFPEGTRIEPIVAPPGMFESFRAAAIYHEGEIAKNIQGNTLTTDANAATKTNALGNVHQDTGETIYEFCAREMEGLFRSQLFQRLCQYNFAGFKKRLTPKLVLYPDKPENILQTAQAMQIGIQEGVIWKREKWLREKFGAPPIDPDTEAALDAEEAAAKEAEARMREAQTTGQTNIESDRQAQQALSFLTPVIQARNQQEAAGGASH